MTASSSKVNLLDLMAQSIAHNQTHSTHETVRCVANWSEFVSRLVPNTKRIDWREIGSRTGEKPTPIIWLGGSGSPAAINRDYVSAASANPFLTPGAGHIIDSHVDFGLLRNVRMWANDYGRRRPIYL